MKILLFGASGLLGRALRQELSGHSVTAPTHKQADIINHHHLDALFQQYWDVVINAAAQCDFDACELDPLKTAKVNMGAPLELAERSHAADALFVQFSSDYVFRGDEDRLLTENDSTHPLSAYGKQKAAIEPVIPKLCPRSLIIRLAWLYGEGGKTFMSLLPQLLTNQETLRVATGKRGRCLYVRDAASWIVRMMEAEDTGLFNLVNEGDTSWEEFAHFCLEKLHNLGAKPRCKRIEEIPYENLGPHWAKRPRYSCLDIQRLRATHPPGPQPWTDALTKFLHEQNAVAASCYL